MNSTVNFLLLATLLFGCEEKVDESLKYLKQEPPSENPEIFAPDFISKKTESEFGSVFSKDGNEFFYGVDNYGKSEIRYTKLVGAEWSEPVTIIFHEKYGTYHQ